MKSITKLDIKLRKTSDSGIFHDSRKDIRTLGSCITALISKVNELVEINNQLSEALNLMDNEGG